MRIEEEVAEELGLSRAARMEVSESSSALALSSVRLSSNGRRMEPVSTSWLRWEKEEKIGINQYQGLFQHTSTKFEDCFVRRISLISDSGDNMDQVLVRKAVEQEVKLLREFFDARCDSVVKLITYEEDSSAVYVATYRFSTSLCETVPSASKNVESDAEQGEPWQRQRKWAHDLIKSVSGLHDRGICHQALS